MKVWYHRLMAQASYVDEYLKLSAYQEQFEEMDEDLLEEFVQYGSAVCIQIEDTDEDKANYEMEIPDIYQYIMKIVVDDSVKFKHLPERCQNCEDVEQCLKSDNQLNGKYL